MVELTRRQAIAMAGAGLLPLPAWAQAPGNILMRTIPSSGEKIPVVGLGTDSFQTDDDAMRTSAAQVIDALLASGATLIDTASTYGYSETVLGGVMAAGKLRSRIFIATKLESPNADELASSRKRLQTGKIDLLQLHNVDDPNQSLARFKEWKAQGICRYIGITSTYHGNYDAVEAVTRREKPDFVQVGYSLDDRLAEQRVLPAAADAGAGVLTALPFGRARLFRAVHGKDVPDWARGFAQSWAQFFLKFLLADPRITAVIPGTTDPKHMADNAGALMGPLPDPDQRKRMIQFAETL